YNWDAKYSQYVEGPLVILHDGRLIVAGEVKDLGTVASFQFRPQIDSSGRLKIELLNVAGGRLPLPQSIWTSYRDQLSRSIRQNMPLWQARARIESAGAANASAMSAMMGRML